MNEYLLTHIHSYTTDITQEAKEPKCPSTNKWIHKMCCMSTIVVLSHSRELSQNIQPETERIQEKGKGKLLNRFSAKDYNM